LINKALFLYALKNWHKNGDFSALSQDHKLQVFVSQQIYFYDTP